jgi:hypothetical protein
VELEFYAVRDTTKKKQASLAGRGRGGPSTIVVFLSHDAIKDAYWEKLGASSSDSELEDAFWEKLGSE